MEKNCEKNNEIFDENFSALRPVHPWTYDFCKLDFARRKLSHYFNKIATLGESGAIDRDTVRAVLRPDQVDYYAEYVQPLEDATLKSATKKSRDDRLPLAARLYIVSGWPQPESELQA